MRHSLLWFPVAVMMLTCGSLSRADEKNGVLLTVAKTTLDRADQRATYYTSGHIDRTEALKVSIKNTSFKPLPAGEVRWEILVRKYSFNTVESTSGTEKLQALRPAEAADVTIGGAQVQGMRDGTTVVKDKIEWQVSVFVEGKELIKVSSTSGFDTIAKRATKVEPAKK